MKYLTTAELENIKRALDAAGTPPDNVFRRMIAEICYRRGIKTIKHLPKKVTAAEVKVLRERERAALRRLSGF